MEIEGQSASAAHWSRQQYESLFAISDPPLSQHVVLVVEGSSGMPSGTKSDEIHQVLAFLVAHRIETEWELENIVVGEKFQRSKVGTRLLLEFIRLAQAQSGRAIFLEVRSSNLSACALYRKLGFVETGLRKAYYTKPSEDAILYRRSLPDVSHNETAPEIWH
jgi:ribosomal-protein-alanine acetyltransferase